MTAEAKEVVALEPVSRDGLAEVLRHAIDKDVSVETIERLVALQERITDKRNAQEFANALASFQAGCPVIARTSKAKITTRGGVTYSYTYADLDHIVRTIREPLRLHGLSFSWDSKTDEGNIHCQCLLRHVNGHKSSANFSCPTSSPSGMSDQQKVASALSFARRQSLVQVLGLTMTEPDTDANDPTTITAGQCADLEALSDEVGADVGKFLKYLGVEMLDDIRAVDYSAAVAALEKKRRQ